MALVSPGVQVSVIDESFYTPAEPGTTPLIFVATKENKANPGNTGIAPGTLAANAEKVYLVSSQRELAETFGDPLFYTDSNNNPIHGGEQNEYGLQAAYSFLGVSNRAYIVRANIDLASLDASADATAGKPANGAYWFDTNDTLYGIFEWNNAVATATNGQSFTNKTPTVITDTTKVVNFGAENYTPVGSVGAVGDYAVVAVTNTNRFWYKNYTGAWVEVGSVQWAASIPTISGNGSFTLPVVGDGISFTVGASTGTAVAATTSPQDFVDLINGLAVDGVSASLSSAGILIIHYDGTGTTEFVTIGGDAPQLEAAGLTAGNFYAPKLQITPHTNVPQYKIGDVTSGRPTGSIWIKTTTPNLGANWNVKLYNSSADSWTIASAPIYATNHSALFGLDATGGGANVAEGSLYIQSNSSEATNPLATFKIFRKAGSGAVSVTSKIVAETGPAAGIYSLSIRESVSGSAVLGTAVIPTIETLGTVADAEIVAGAINAAGLTNVSARVDGQNRIVLTHALGGEIRIDDTAGAELSGLFAGLFDVGTNANLSEAPDGTTTSFVVSYWRPLSYTASDNEPTTTPADGALWYSSIVDEVDIMVHDGDNWVGYLTAHGSTGANGPVVSATEPVLGSAGQELEENDLWISTADIENYPTIYRRNAANRWVLVDKSDQTTESGILFADARYNTSGVNSNVAGDIVELLTSQYLDPDAPDPALYPKGMLLWNLRRSGFNVKRFERSYIDVNALNTRFKFNNNDEPMSDYYANRWVTESANNADGSGSFGRNAQRKVIVQKLQSVVNSNDEIRDDESRIFNLIATPGYPELIGEMITLNFDRGLTSFVIGDSPMRLRPNTTELNNWATNVNQAVEDNDLGLVSRDEYMGVYYPSGFTSDNAGNNIVVPPSHMVMRTIALNDQVAYPWFAPAGTRRGGVTNATAAGYITGEGEFVSIALNEGQRDTLYQNNVNPITFLNGAGLVVFGQKTRARNASALDRVNVARLVIYLRSQLKQLAKPYIFEPNDKITRDEIKQQVESLLVELVGLRALYDYLVVCDETNNTPSRIDRNELYVDIAIEPVKAVEFIYIPLRLKNTGEIAGL
jgi:hypothetical protein